MQTCKEMSPAIGQIIGMKVESFVIPVVVKDVKQSWGQTRFLVSPIEGLGEVWCEIHRFSKWSCSPAVPGLNAIQR